MATAPTQVHDRAFEEACLRWAVANIDGVQSIYLSLPAGFGDCALLECSAQVSTIATMMTNPTLSGPAFGLFDSEGTAIPVDVQFSEKWILVLADGLHARAAPDQVQFWQENEMLRILFAEVDTNATPTGDLTVLAKVRRLRPTLTRTPEETHFFLTS